MHPILFELPIVVLLAAGGLIAGLFLVTAWGRKGWAALAGALCGMLVGLAWAWRQGLLTDWWPVRGYGVMILLGFLAGVWLAQRRSRQVGINPEHCLDLGLWGVLGGIVGARLFHVIQFWEHYSPNGEKGWQALWGVFKLWEGGLVFFGAFLASVVVTVIYCRVHKIAMLPFLDLAAPSMMAGLALGRVGCFLNGCCYGRVSTQPWAVCFPPDSPPYEHFWGGLGIMPCLHPAQLYASVGAALSFAFLYAYWPRRRFDGQLFGIMLMMAGVTRFFEEVLRADTAALFPSFTPSISVAQWFGVALVLGGAVYVLGCWHHSRQRALR